LPPDHNPGNDHHGHGHPHSSDHHHELPDDCLWAFGSPGTRPLRIGIGGPVGSGKTALVAALCRLLADKLSIVVVTNDIFTTEDAEALRRMAVLPDERIVPVETGACPHTAIRDDISANLDAVEQLEAANAPVDLTLVESGGDNLTAIFSRALVDRQIFVIDVAGGDKVPRKGGPGVTTADLLVVNKTDLAPLVGADLSVMDRDARARRHGLPIVFTSLVQPHGAAAVADWVGAQLGEWQSPALRP
jgi:urease accessory protein